MPTTEVMKRETAVQHQLPGTAPTLLDIIQAFVENPQVDVDKLGQLLALREREEARAAETAYNVAMKMAQSEMQPVLRDAKNESSNSRYARLETIDRMIRPIYARHGFSLSFNSGKPEKPGALRVICRVLHEAGHSKECELEGDLDMTGPKGTANKTSIQGLGSSASYLRRYLTLMIFNVVLTNEDDDGQKAGWVTEQQIQAIETLIAQCVTPEKPDASIRAGLLQQVAHAKLVSEIHARDFQKCVTALEGKKREIARAATSPKQVEEVAALPDAIHPVIGTRMRCKGKVHEVYADTEGIQRWRVV